MNTELMEIDTTAEEQARESSRAIKSAESRVNRLLSELRRMTIQEEEMALLETNTLSAENKAIHDREFRLLVTSMLWRPSLFISKAFSLIFLNIAYF